MTTLLHELERTGGRYGLQTMCEGGGQANVTIIERLCNRRQLPMPRPVRNETADEELERDDRERDVAAERARSRRSRAPGRRGRSGSSTVGPAPLGRRAGAGSGTLTRWPSSRHEADDRRARSAVDAHRGDRHEAGPLARVVLVHRPREHGRTDAEHRRRACPTTITVSALRGDHGLRFGARTGRAIERIGRADRDELGLLGPHPVVGSPGIRDRRAPRSRGRRR